MSALCLLGLLSAIPLISFAKPIVIPVGTDSAFAIKDLDTLKTMFFAYIGGFALWAAKAIYDLFIKKNDSTDAKIDALIEEMHSMRGTIDRMSGRLENFATKNEAQDIAQKAVKFYDELRR